MGDEEEGVVVKAAGDKYRSLLKDETQNTQWRHGGPPIFDTVNKLFEEGRTKVDESMRAEDVEIYYDPAELFSGLLKGSQITESQAEEHKPEVHTTSTHRCPFYD